MFAAVVCAGGPSARADDVPIILFADRDDDDADGVPDAEQAAVPSSGELLRVPRPKVLPVGASFKVRGNNVRVLADGIPLPVGGLIPPRATRIEIQAIRAGRAEVDIFGQTLSIGALALHLVDGDGDEVDLARSHASLQRTPPDRLRDDPFASNGDPDALRFVIEGLAADLPPSLSLLSYGAQGLPLDALSALPLGRGACPHGTEGGMTCVSTWPIRAVGDDIDRTHPLVAARSLKAELGGSLAIVSGVNEKLQRIRVLGPRKTPIGPVDRYRARLRFFLVRHTPHGPPPVGQDDAAAVEVARAEVEHANALWGACGVSFGPPRELWVRVVDPPPPHMLAMGCDHGLPASGGTIRVRVDGRAVVANVARGMLPSAAARAVAAAIVRSGFEVRVSDNPGMGAGAYGTSDVLVRRKGGELATIETPGRGPVSSDATMTACIGRVDLDDGLQHFSDVDAVTGTVEERALIKAFDDGDPKTIEVFLVPSFRGGGRVGESFIAADGGAVRNVLIEDRAGVRLDRASFPLAHELGHILLDDPGHPDDFGVDTPTRLMDADAANPSAYGPRRLLVDECTRAIRQSGPNSPVPLLTPWPIPRR